MVLYRASRDVQQVGGLGVREPVADAQHDHLTLSCGEASKRVLQPWFEPGTGRSRERQTESASLAIAMTARPALTDTERISRGILQPEHSFTMLPRVTQRLRSRVTTEFGPERRDQRRPQPRLGRPEPRLECSVSGAGLSAHVFVPHVHLTQPRHPSSSLHHKSDRTAASREDAYHQVEPCRPVGRILLRIVRRTPAQYGTMVERSSAKAAR